MLISTPPLSPNATVNAAGRRAPAQQRSGGGDSGKMVLERRPSGRCVGGGAALALLGHRVCVAIHELSGRVILRTSPVRSSRKFAHRSSLSGHANAWEPVVL